MSKQKQREKYFFKILTNQFERHRKAGDSNKDHKKKCSQSKPVLFDGREKDRIPCGSNFV
jgi:hypothetical protein